MIDLNHEADAFISKCLDMPRDLLRGVMSYNGSMTISQVVKFFERQGVVFTKPMIQHYVKIGLLPPPEDKRRYTRFHLLLLAVIEQLKGLFTLDEISFIFNRFSPDDRLIDLFREMTESAVAYWRETLNRLADKALETANGMGLDSEAGHGAFEAFLLLGVMSQGAAAKQAAGLLIEKRAE